MSTKRRREPPCNLTDLDILVRETRRYQIPGQEPFFYPGQGEKSAAVRLVRKGMLSTALSGMPEGAFLVTDKGERFIDRTVLALQGLK